MKTYVQIFDTLDDAWAHMIDQNRARAPADRQPGAESFALYCLVNAPKDKVAVVDMETAVDMGAAYEWNTEKRAQP